MANHCDFCETRRPEGGTSLLILHGNQWLEFCEPCGNTEKLTNPQTGETRTIKEVFDMCVESETVLNRMDAEFIANPVIEEESV